MSEYCKNCEELLKRATVAEDNFACEVQARLYHQTKWLEYSEECEKYKQALEEIEKVANCSDCLPCLKHYCDCENCNDESTDNGERCMQYGLEKILDIISKARE